MRGAVRKAGGHLAGLALLSLGACTESNPLIGVWEVEEPPGVLQQMVSRVFSSMTFSELEFTEDKMIFGSTFCDAEYEVAESRVLVQTDCIELGLVFQRLEEGRISLALPGGQTLTYRRRDD